MKRLAALVAIAYTISLAPLADAKCANQHLSAQVHSDAPNGAIVMLTSTSYELSGDDKTAAWRFKINGKDVMPVIEVLAPGLAVYRLPKDVATGDLFDGKTKTKLVTARVTTKLPDLLPAPNVKAVLHEIDDNEGRGRSSETTVKITGNVPADAVAIVIADAKGKALSFGKVLAGQPLEPYSHPRCGVLPDGTEEPTIGASVRLFWVDKYGRASAKSAPTKIVKGS